MAKKSQSKISKPRRKSTKLSGASKDVREFARLLASPCSSPLVAPPYEGFQLGELVRKKTTLSFGTTSRTRAMVYLAPTATTQGNEAGTEWFGAVGYDSLDTQGATASPRCWSAPELALQPGHTIAGALRPLAACIRIIYTGKESDRKGLVYSGIIPYASAIGDHPFNTFEQLLDNCTRLSDEVEQKWCPNLNDMEWHAPRKYEDRNDLIREFGGCNATVVILDGVDLASVQIEFHAVYQSNGGTVLTDYAKLDGKTPSFTMAQVARYLAGFPGWMYSNSSAARAALDMALARGASAVGRMLAGG